MAEFSSLGAQIVNPGESVTFTLNPVPCTKGLIRHREGSGSFLLSGKVNGCCKCNPAAVYYVNFGANISVPTGETPGAISLAIAIDGSTIQDSTMTVTPAAVEEEFSVSRTKSVDIWRGCCETVSVRNISAIPVQVSNPVINFSKSDSSRNSCCGNGGNVAYVY